MGVSSSIRILCLVALVLAYRSNAQSIINYYAKVSSISGTTVNLSNANLAYASMNVGDNVIIMQMQDDVIGANTSNDAAFGQIASIGNAGRYEKATITSITTGANQTYTIWQEDFEDLSAGANSDNGNTSWTTTCGSCGTGVRVFSVSNQTTIGGSRLFEGRRMDGGGATWTSEAIAISDFSNISISIAVAQSGYDNETTDNISALYSIDGGAYQQFGYVERNFAAQNLTVSGLSGSSISVRVIMNSNANNDYGRFDNVTVTGEKPTPTSITISTALTNTYNTGTNSSVQLISYPRFTNYTTQSDLTGLAWNGNVGGVFAIDVTNKLTLAHNISMNQLGFRGGTANPTGDGSGCNSTNYRTNANGIARKGEGIYLSTTASYVGGRAPIANGGGGASVHNGGGGGGGNFTPGGDGGPGWNGTTSGCSPSAGGIGGLDLSEHISSSRIFLGGGGGGGQQNNNLTPNGGNGGGIIIIKAGTIELTGGCGGGFSISANGGIAPDAGNDGGSGAGAGGSILFEVGNWSLGCQLNVTANGGAGGSVGSTAAHGGGGGGGRGVIILSGSAPAANFTANNSEGAGGSNSSNGTGGTAATGGTIPTSPTADPDGIVETTSGPLPVSLLAWRGEARDFSNILYWSTANELNNDYYIIERSSDLENWQEIAHIQGAGNSTAVIHYRYEDRNPPLQKLYYRLSQIDYDGSFEYFKVISLQSKISQANMLMYPNPTNGVFKIDCPITVIPEDVSLQVVDLNQKSIDFEYEIFHNQIQVILGNINPGVYLVRLKLGTQLFNFRMVHNK